jgi:hypothetical protein
MVRTAFRNEANFQITDNAEVTQSFLGLVKAGSPLVNIKVNGGFDSHTPPPAICLT